MRFELSGRRSVLYAFVLNVVTTSSNSSTGTYFHCASALDCRFFSIRLWRWSTLRHCGLWLDLVHWYWRQFSFYSLPVRTWSSTSQNLAISLGSSISDQMCCSIYIFDASVLYSLLMFVNIQSMVSSVEFAFDLWVLSSLSLVYEGVPVDGYICFVLIAYAGWMGWTFLKAPGKSKTFICGYLVRWIPFPSWDAFWCCFRCYLRRSCCCWWRVECCIKMLVVLSLNTNVRVWQQLSRWRDVDRFVWLY